MTNDTFANNSYLKLFLIIDFFGNNFFLLKNSFLPLLRFFVGNFLHRTVLHCILNDSHKYCCHFSMKTCSCPSRNDDPLKFIKLKWSIGHTKFRFIFFQGYLMLHEIGSYAQFGLTGYFNFTFFNRQFFIQSVPD